MAAVNDDHVLPSPCAILQKEKKKERKKDKKQYQNEDKEFMFFPVSTDITLTDVISYCQAQKIIKSLKSHDTAVPFKGEGFKLHINGGYVVLFYINTQLYCIDEKCPHAGGPLHMGDIEDNVYGSPCVTCPWHRFCFNLSTGHVIHPQGHKELQLVTHPVRVDHSSGLLYIGFKSFRPSLFNDINF